MNLIRSRAIYGTAWKKDETARLVASAIRAGFRSIDTAAQPKHYREDLVGQGIREALREGVIQREDLFLQTKFCPLSGQDPKDLPYDPAASVSDQVEASVHQSQRNLRPADDPAAAADTYVDCVLLHAPLATVAATLEAWRALERWVPLVIRSLGIANVDVPTLQALNDAAVIKPAVVQNRFYPGTAYDGPVRAWCDATDSLYEAFWTLTANPRLLGSAPVAALASNVGVERPVALYALILELGNMAVLNGTTNTDRMRSDLEGLQKVKEWAASSTSSPDWEEIRLEFANLLKPAAEI